MKLHFCKNETGNIQVQIETGTVLSEFNYIEMLKQLTQDNQIECDWGALDEGERTKLKELLDKIIGDNTFSYVSREKKLITAMVSMICKIPVSFFKK